ncbi:unnamed protein product [Ophioblennius macclurei]
MMKLILSLALVWAFSSTAGALTCDVCYGNDPLCRATGERLCPENTKCMVAFIRVTSNGQVRQHIFKNCVEDAMCPTTGSTNFSTTLRGISTHVTAECCNTDNCNKHLLKFPAPPKPNYKQCTSCDESTGICDTVQCFGAQDTCLEANVTRNGNTFDVLGCSTSMTCDVARAVNHVPFLSLLGRISGTPVCTAAPVQKAPPLRKSSRFPRNSYYSNSYGSSFPIGYGNHYNYHGHGSHYDNYYGHGNHYDNYYGHGNHYDNHHGHGNHYDNYYGHGNHYDNYYGHGNHYDNYHDHGNHYDNYYGHGNHYGNYHGNHYDNYHGNHHDNYHGHGNHYDDYHGHDNHYDNRYFNGYGYGNNYDNYGYGNGFGHGYGYGYDNIYDNGYGNDFGRRYADSYGNRYFNSYGNGYRNGNGYGNGLFNRYGNSYRIGYGFQPYYNDNNLYYY